MSLAPCEGAQWLSGRVLDSRLRGRVFEPHRRHCVVVLEQRHIYSSFVLVQRRKTRPCLTERLLMGRKKSNQTKKSTMRGSREGAGVRTPPTSPVKMTSGYRFPKKYWYGSSLRNQEKSHNFQHFSCYEQLKFRAQLS